MPGLQNVESAAVLPLACGIVPDVQNGQVSFVITEPGQYPHRFRSRSGGVCEGHHLEEHGSAHRRRPGG